MVYAASRGIGRELPARRVRSGPRTGTHWLVAGWLMPPLAVGVAPAFWLDIADLPDGHALTW